MPSCSQTCRRRPLHPPLPLQSANSPYHFCDRAYSIFPISTILFPDTLFRSSHTSPPLVRSRYTPANERKRFTPSPFSTSKGVSPSTTPSLFRIKTTFPSLLFLIHAASPKRFFSVTLAAEGRILSFVSSPAEFLTSKPAQPPKDCAGSFFSLFMFPLRFLFLPSVSKKSPEEGSPPASVPVSRQTPAAAL